MEQPEFTILQAGGPPERRAALGQALRQEGFRVAEALFELGPLLAVRPPPDLILLHTPSDDASGLRLRDQLHVASPAVPVLFVPPDNFTGLVQALYLARHYQGELRLSDARFHAVIDSRPARIALVDQEGCITAVNKAWSDFAAASNGNPAGLAEGADYLTVCRKGAASGAEGAREFLDGLLAVLGGGVDHFTSVYPCDGPAGREWFLARVTGLGDGRGAIVAHENITDLKKTQAELHRTHQRLVTILDKLGDGFFALDAEWRITYVNKAAERLLRRPRDLLLGRIFWDAAPEARDSAAWEAFHRAVATQTPTSFLEFHALLQAWLDVQATPSPEGLLVLARDVTEQRQRAERDAARHMERLAGPVAAEVTASLFGSGSIRETTPAEFEELARAYEEMLDLALQQRGYKVSHNLSERLGDLAERLGFLRAGPRDLVALHTLAVKRKTRSAPGPKVQALIEESRLVLLELMGNLVSHYRLQSLGARTG